MSTKVSTPATKARVVALPTPAKKMPDWSDLSLDDLAKEPRIHLKEIANIVGCHPLTVVKHIKSDGLPAKKIGNKWESREILVKRWLAWFLLQ